MNDYRDDEPGTHTILVAFEVPVPTRREAEEALHTAMPFKSTGIAWWVAEDERYDRSDNDSAVFVALGKQDEAVALLRAHGLTA